MRDTSKRCPDNGYCHHQCGDKCSRVQSCAPVSGIFVDDVWPAFLRVAHKADDKAYTIDQFTAELQQAADLVVEHAVAGGKRLRQRLDAAADRAIAASLDADQCAAVTKRIMEAADDATQEAIERVMGAK